MKEMAVLTVPALLTHRGSLHLPCISLPVERDTQKMKTGSRPERPQEKRRHRILTLEFEEGAYNPKEAGSS